MLATTTHSNDENGKDTMYEFCAELLKIFFRETSKQFFNLNSIDDIEHHVWKAIAERNPEALEELQIGEREIQLLMAISQKIGGWLEGTAAKSQCAEPEFRRVSLPYWEKRFNEWKSAE